MRLKRKPCFVFVRFQLRQQTDDFSRDDVRCLRCFRLRRKQTSGLLCPPAFWLSLKEENTFTSSRNECWERERRLKLWPHGHRTKGDEVYLQMRTQVETIRRKTDTPEGHTRAGSQVPWNQREMYKIKQETTGQWRGTKQEVLLQSKTGSKPNKFNMTENMTTRPGGCCHVWYVVSSEIKKMTRFTVKLLTDNIEHRWTLTLLQMWTSSLSRWHHLILFSPPLLEKLDENMVCSSVY